MRGLKETLRIRGRRMKRQHLSTTVAMMIEARRRGCDPEERQARARLARAGIRLMWGRELFARDPKRDALMGGGRHEQ